MVSVPCWFTDAQRRAVLDASNIAGLNVLRLLNETAATALCWGLPKTMDLPEDSATPKHVLFVDMGHRCVKCLPPSFSVLVCLVSYLGRLDQRGLARSQRVDTVEISPHGGLHIPVSGSVVLMVCVCVGMQLYAGVPGGLYQGQDECAGVSLRQELGWP